MLPFKFSIFWKNVAKVGSGTTIAQIVSLLLGPLITRLYSPEVFGAAGLFLSISGVIVIISSFRLERALFLVSEENRNYLFSICIIISTVFALLSFVIILFIGFIYPIIKIENVYYLLPIYIYFISLYNILYAYINGLKYYTLISVTTVILSLLVSSSRLGFGYLFESSAEVYIGAELIALLLIVSMIIIALRQGKIQTQYSDKTLKVKYRLSNIIRVFNVYKSFPKFDIITSLLNSLSWYLPSYFIAFFFGNQILGFYTLGFAMVRMPMNLLGKAIGDVFYKQATDDFSQDKLGFRAVSTIDKLLSFGILPSILLAVMGSDIFSLVFGQNWETAGTYSAILSIWSLIWLISSPISTLFYVIDEQEKFMLIVLVGTVLRFFVLIVGGFFSDPIIMIVLFSLAGSLIYGYQIIFLLKKLKVDLSLLLVQLCRKNFYIVLVVIALILTKILLNDQLQRIIISSLIVVVGIVYLLKKETNAKEVISNI